eukprot:7980865-Alexandrium_andersonii.AAC.1
MPNAPRASVLHGARTVPEVAMDDCFLTKDGSDVSVTVLVLKDRALERSWRPQSRTRAACARARWAKLCPASIDSGTAARSCSRRTMSRP